MAQLTGKISKSDGTIVERDGHRVLVGASSDIWPDGFEYVEDDNQKIADDGDYWSVSMGPIPILCEYDTWDDVPDDEQWWWKDGYSVEIFAGPPAMRSLAN